MSRKVIIIKRRGGLAGVIVLAAILVGLAASNPDMGDFGNYLSGQARAQAQGSGVLHDLAANLGGAISGAAANLYYRKNYVIFSAFAPRGSNKVAYYGFAKVVFIKVAK
jgi:hypothetical protein